MSELTRDGRTLRLAYSMNVHPCETLADLEAAIPAGPADIRRRLFPGKPTGVGLRLSAAAADELAANPAALDRLCALLDRHGLFAFTANVFPFGNFNDGRVKEEVYRPSWRTRERVAYTIAAAHALARLAGKGSVTLSTVAGGRRADGDDRAARDEMARNLGQTAGVLHTLREETGVSVRICLEPEPLTTCETAADIVEFFRNHVYPGGERALHGTARYNAGQATDILHEHLGLCYDTCHQAVLWEDPVASIDRIERSGIVIGKVQLSCALEGPPAALAALHEPRYFHQVAAVTGRRADDLDACASWPEDLARTHFHVPIFLQHFGGLSTTRPYLEACVGAILKRDLCRDFEIETYTWDVIPEVEREQLCGRTLVESLEKEYRYAVELLR